jgi:hypothetical protein
MAFDGFDNEIARLAILQRIELATPFLVKIRKLFGRYLFTNFFTKFLLPKHKINYRYYNRMLDEYNSLRKYIDFTNKNILSIGAGMCGLELIIDKFNTVNQFYIIEKNYVSKKIKYGWDDKNFEAYNNLTILKNFLKNNLKNSNFNVYDFDSDNFPHSKFDIIISLYSLDYHYNFSIYKDYFAKICSDKTLIVFDTIRPNYFEKFFNRVEVVSETKKRIHSSKRIICSEIINDKFK